jgi:FdhD protein
MKPKTVRTQPKAADGASVTAQVWRCNGSGSPERQTDSVACEEPLEIRVRGRSVAVVLRTPGHDQELAAGFLLSEGLISQPEDIVESGHCLQGAGAGNIFNVFLAPRIQVDFNRLTRHVFASSSCGLCGKASIEAVHQHFPPIQSAPTISPKLLRALPARMQAAQQAFAETGGLHAAALFDTKGKLVAVREDVGRHNAVDKILGYGLLAGMLPFASHVLLVSGRASFEIMQKALAARIAIVCAVSAPSSLAVDFATESGQTLVGFLRGETMNVYTWPGRCGFGS